MARGRVTLGLGEPGSDSDSRGRRVDDWVVPEWTGPAGGDSGSESDSERGRTGDSDHVRLGLGRLGVTQ
jgi:hypothetical protein